MTTHSDILQKALFGEPPTAGHQPSKEEVLQAFSGLEDDVIGLGEAQIGGGIIFDTLTEMNANLDYDEFQKAENDEDNGVYQKQGASGTGSWLRIGDRLATTLDTRITTLEDEIDPLTQSVLGLLNTDTNPFQLVGNRETNVATSTAGTNTFVFDAPATARSFIRTLEYLSSGNGTLYVRTWDKSGDTFTMAKEKQLTIVTGTNNFELSDLGGIFVEFGQYVGFYADVGASLGSSTDHDDYFVGSGNKTTFTDSDTSSAQFQLTFKLGEVVEDSSPLDVEAEFTQADLKTPDAEDTMMFSEAVTFTPKRVTRSAFVEQVLKSPTDHLREMIAEILRLGSDGTIVQDPTGLEILGVESTDGRMRTINGHKLSAPVIVDDVMYILGIMQDNGTFPVGPGINIKTGENVLGRLDDKSRNLNDIGEPAGFFNFGKNLIETDSTTGYPILDIQPIFGQSNAITGGKNSDTIYSTVQEPFIHLVTTPQMLMPNIGMVGNEAKTQRTITDIIPAVNAYRPGRGIAEGFAIPGMLQTAYDQVQDNLVTYQLGFSAGDGGETLAELLEGIIPDGGTVSPFENLITAITEIVALLNDTSSGYKMTARIKDPILVQGEADGSTAISAYRTSLATLQTQLNTRLQAIVSRSTAYKLIVSQTPTAVNYSGTLLNSTLAQYEESEANTNVILAPGFCNMKKIDTVHGNEQGDREHGALLYHYVDRVMRLSESNPTCKPTALDDIERVGTTITIPTIVPNGDLQIDTDKVPESENYGFHWSGTGGITNVSVGTTTSNLANIILTLATDAGGTLTHSAIQTTATMSLDADNTYPHSGAYTNIRDKAVYNAAVPGEPIANWLAAFQVDLA